MIFCCRYWRGGERREEEDDVQQTHSRRKRTHGPWLSLTLPTTYISVFPCTLCTLLSHIPCRFAVAVERALFSTLHCITRTMMDSVDHTHNPSTLGRLLLLASLAFALASHFFIRPFPRADGFLAVLTFLAVSSTLVVLLVSARDAE